jgi:hypothetical protein
MLAPQSAHAREKSSAVGISAPLSSCSKDMLSAAEESSEERRALLAAFTLAETQPFRRASRKGVVSSSVSGVSL